MKALIIYDSYFGNTEKIAMAICSSLGGPGDVAALKVTNVTVEQLRGLDLLVVGSPTRGFRPSEGTRRFLKNITAGSLNGVRVAAFDTRIEMNENVPGILRFFAKIFGFAAKPIAVQLTKKGGTQIVPPEGFIVKASQGPLKDGELERATGWGDSLLTTR